MNKSLRKSAAENNAALAADQARSIAVDAYVLFYPMKTMDVTRKQITNVPSGKKSGFDPMNMFHNITGFPPADLKAVVRINFDTLYSIAWPGSDGRANDRQHGIRHPSGKCSRPCRSSLQQEKIN